MAAPSPDTLAAQLARCVEQFRDPGSVQAQKLEFRALMHLLRQQGLTIRDDRGRMLVNGAPMDGGGAALGALTRRLELHNVGEISMPREPPPAEVFQLVKALAEQPGEGDIPSLLRAAGVTQVRAALGATSPPDAPAPPGTSGAGAGLGTEGILRGEPMTDIASPRERVGGVPALTHDPLPPSEETALPSTGMARPSDALPSVDTPSQAAPVAAPTPPAPPPPRRSRPVPAPVPPPAPTPPPPPARAAGPERGVAPGSPSGDFGPASARGQKPDAVLAELARNPNAANVGDLLAVLGQQVENAARANRVEQALAVLAGVVQQEARVTDASARRHYSIALRRMYSKALIKEVAQLLAAPAHRDAAVVVLRRAGADAVELLIERLVAAQTIGERRGVFDALRQMSEGRGQLVQMLTHHQWFVVRNVAELVGEMGLEAAVPGLAKQIEHPDERVRKAVALALAKIGSGSAAEALRRALRDKSAEVRMQVALGVGGRRSSALAMPLVVALQEEKDETVQRELLLALGRIGTADAVQALIKVVQPAGRLFGRKPVALRVAAVEALRIAATPVAAGTLEGLAGDPDRQVGAAAQDALEDLKRRKT